MDELKMKFDGLASHSRVNESQVAHPKPSRQPETLPSQPEYPTKEHCKSLAPSREVEGKVVSDKFREVMVGEKMRIV